MWSSRICFYFDAKHFIHKKIQWIRQRLQKVWSRERKVKAWLRETTKGNKAGHGGKVASFLLLYHLVKELLLQALRKLSGKLFAEFTENKFLEIFKSSCNPTGNVFVQDDDPSQNSKAAKTALAVRILILSRMLLIQWKKIK